MVTVMFLSLASRRDYVYFVLVLSVCIYIQLFWKYVLLIYYGFIVYVVVCKILNKQN